MSWGQEQAADLIAAASLCVENAGGLQAVAIAAAAGVLDQALEEIAKTLDEEDFETLRRIRVLSRSRANIKLLDEEEM